jgi:hypothetical protein
MKFGAKIESAVCELMKNTSSGPLMGIPYQTKLRRWCSGIMQDSHSCDPGSIPGRRTLFSSHPFRSTFITIGVPQHNLCNSARVA